MVAESRAFLPTTLEQAVPYTSSEFRSPAAQKFGELAAGGFSGAGIGVGTQTLFGVGRLLNTRAENKSLAKTANALEEQAQGLRRAAQDNVRLSRNAQAQRRGAVIQSFAARGFRSDADTATPMDAFLLTLQIQETNNARVLFQANEEAKELEEQAKRLDKQKTSKLTQGLRLGSTLTGAAIGGYFGGPAGAAAGAQIGGGIAIAGT